MDVKFYRCKKCGQMVYMVNKTGCDIYCCGEAMQLLIPGETDGAYEKHIPEYEIKDGVVYVTVGSVLHPMTEPHYIEFIVLETNNGIQAKKLTYKDLPKAEFKLLEGDSVKAVYEYCNLHGLWRK